MSCVELQATTSYLTTLVIPLELERSDGEWSTLHGPYTSTTNPRSPPHPSVMPHHEVSGLRHSADLLLRNSFKVMATHGMVQWSPVILLLCVYVSAVVK